MNTKRSFTLPIKSELGDVQDAMAIEAIRYAAAAMPRLELQDADRCPYCGLESLALAVETWGGGLLSHGTCAECGTTTAGFSESREPVSLPWSVPAMFSSVA